MVEINVLCELADKSSFSVDEFFDVYRNNGCQLGEAALRKKLQEFLKRGDIVRVGRGRYCISVTDVIRYEHRYSALSCEVAEIMKKNHPYLDFTIFELSQFNEFLNHQLAHNVIFLSVEEEIAAFVFDTLKEVYPGKVLMDPSVEIYDRYWYDNMIVIEKLITEAPKGIQISWHTRIEKMLVDMMSEQILAESVSESEYPAVFEDAFKRYVIDESCLFRYAKRRGAKQRIENLIKEKTAVTLRME